MVRAPAVLSRERTAQGVSVEGRRQGRPRPSDAEDMSPTTLIAQRADRNGSNLSSWLKVTARGRRSRRPRSTAQRITSAWPSCEDGERRTCRRDGRPVVVSAAAEPNLFKWDKLNNLVFSLVFCAIVLAFIQVAKRRPNLFIRQIAGLDAVDEAIGRVHRDGPPGLLRARPRRHRRHGDHRLGQHPARRWPAAPPSTTAASA